MDTRDTMVSTGESEASRQTVVGLFEDQIDAEQTLLALRKSDHSPDRVSLVVRDKAAEEGGGDGAGAVARAVVATALDAVAGWLQGLASLIVPERGTFLVAGPIGAALAGIGGVDAERGGYAAAADLSAGGLLRTIGEFGFSAEEANYLEHRLAAGVTLIAVTTDDATALQATRRLFADHNAVHIGLAQTDSRFFEETEALLNAPPEASSGGDVVVTDAVAPLRRVGADGGSPLAAALRHREVIDAAGDDVGKVEDVLEDESGQSGAVGTHAALRYLVVGFGGVLGLRRHHVVVPASFADLGSDPIRLNVEKAVLQRAPAFDEDAPFSRREERAVCAYFGCDPYWLER